MLTARLPVQVWVSCVTVVMVGCIGSLPEPITVGAVDTFFPEDDAGSTADQALHGQAEQCASRLNRHIGLAKRGLRLRSAFTGLGGFVGGGSGIAGIFGDSNGFRTAMAITSAVGAAITLVGNLVVGLAADPAEELELFQLGRRSWDRAVSFSIADGESTLQLGALRDCIQDRAPVDTIEGPTEAVAW